MSAYEDAVQALAQDLAMGDPFELYLESAERVKVFLAALPPSIIVDGRVVEVSTDGDVSDWLVDACEMAGISVGAFAYVFDAAREVADHG